MRAIADEMGLQEWRFEILIKSEIKPGGMKAHDDDGLHGVGGCSPVTGQHQAEITFIPEFRDMPRDKVREIVVHELCHCLLFDMREFMRTGTLEHLAQATYDALMFGFDMAWEHAVDSISRAWAEKMPLIQWPK